MPAEPMSSERPAEVVIGLDVGTTGVKAVAFGLRSSWRRVAIREYPLLHPAPDQEVQDPAALLAAVAQALAECARTTAGAEVLAISVSTAMHGLIALDDDLRPLTQLITWADSRARAEACALRSSYPDLHPSTGAPLHPMTPLAKLVWFAGHDPAMLAAARWWAGLKDWVLLWLTGRLVTELSSASGTGLLDMATRTWSEAALGVAGISADRLPPILPTTATLELSAAAARQTSLPSGTPVVAGAGDGPLANVGTGAITPGLAGLSIGTSGAARMALATPYVDPERTLFCYALTDTLWIAGGAISNGGVVVRWAEEALGPPVAAPGSRDQALLDLAATAPAGSDGLVMLPYLLAERAPLWDPDLPGAYLGLRREHTRAHLVRAAVEGVCLQLRLIVDRLDDVAPVRTIRATGGVFRSPLWREALAGMLAREIEFVGDAEGSALGAAALGLLALGRTKTLPESLELLAPPGTAPPPAVIAPAELVQTYDRLRASLPELVGELDRVADLLRDVPGPPGRRG